MPRLFSALELPPTARTHLSLLRGEISGARWTAPDNMHITLRFFGDVSDLVADELVTHLDGVEAQPVQIEIAGTGTFGSENETVVFAVVKPSVELVGLQKLHERVARVVGLGAPKHAFKPHVTLARARRPRPTMLARFLAETASLKLAPFLVHRFVLFSSRPNRGGGPYAIESAVSLGDEDK